MPRAFATCLGEGMTLFNAGSFHAAHEVWEEAWRYEHGPRRLLLQALILAAAGWLKRDAGNARGAWTLFSRALERLESLAPTCEGMDVNGLRRDITRWRVGEGADRPLLARSLDASEGEP
jgi:predicted metal-dependent hydrolase